MRNKLASMARQTGLRSLQDRDSYGGHTLGSVGLTSHQLNSFPLRQRRANLIRPWAHYLPSFELFFSLSGGRLETWLETEK
jgi:hypothetical protein